MRLQSASWSVQPSSVRFGHLASQSRAGKTISSEDDNDFNCVQVIFSAYLICNCSFSSFRHTYIRLCSFNQKERKKASERGFQVFVTLKYVFARSDHTTIRHRALWKRGRKDALLFLRNRRILLPFLIII